VPCNKPARTPTPKALVRQNIRQFQGSISTRQALSAPFPTTRGDYWLAKEPPCSQIVYVKTVTYPIRIPQRDYAKLVAEANRRRKSLADLFRDLITYGLPALPPIPETYEALQEVWDNLGPAPEILYDKLPRER
jgi:hypothetical protein